MNSLIKLVIGVRPVPLAKTLASYQYSPLQQVFVRGGKVRWGADAPVTSLDRYASEFRCRPNYTTVLKPKKG